MKLDEQLARVKKTITWGLGAAAGLFVGSLTAVLLISGGTVMEALSRGFGTAAIVLVIYSVIALRQLNRACNASRNDDHS